MQGRWDVRLAVLASAAALLVSAVMCGCSDSTSPKGDGGPESPVNVQGQWIGAWESSVHAAQGDFVLTLLQDRTVLTGTIDIPSIGMSDVAVSGTVTATQIAFGDIDQRISFVGTVTADSLSASGTYNYPAINDQGTWEATKGAGGFITLVDSLGVPPVVSGDITFDGEHFRLLGANEMIYTVDPSIGVVDSLVTPGAYPSGIAFDGEWLLVGDGSMGAHRIFLVDPVHPSVLRSPGSSGITGLAYDGSYLWCINDHYATPTIYQLDPDGTVVGSLSCPGTSARGLAYDGSHLWYTAFDAGRTNIYRIDLTGTLVSFFEAPTFLTAGLTFDGSHLWCAGRFDHKIYQLDTAGQTISSFDSPGESPADLAFDGTHLWHADGNISPGPDQIYRLDTLGNVVSSFDCPGDGPGGLAFDGTHLWHADTHADRIYRLATSGDNYRVCPAAEIQDLTCDGTHLWSHDPTAGTIYSFNASGEIVNSFEAPCPSIGGLVWDGTSLWVAASDFLRFTALLRLSPDGEVLASYLPPERIPAAYGLAFDGVDLWYIGRIPYTMSYRLYRLKLE